MGGLESISVLIVDDYMLMNKMLRSVLTGIGIGTVYSEYSGEKALEILRRQKPDIVFADLNMKPMDGLEFTRHVRNRASSPCPFVPVIMVSGHSEERYVQLARDAGVTEFLAKPISARTLFDRLVAVVEHPRPFVKTEGFFGPDRRRHKSADYKGPERRAQLADLSEGAPDLKSRARFNRPDSEFLFR